MLPSVFPTLVHRLTRAVQLTLRAERLDKNVAPGRWRGRRSNPYASVALVGGDNRAAVAGSGGVENSHVDVTVGLGKTKV